MIETGVGERLKKLALIHHGIELRFDGRGHRIDFADLTGGKASRSTADRRSSRTSPTRASRRAGKSSSKSKT